MGRPLPHRLQGVPVAPAADLGFSPVAAPVTPIGAASNRTRACGETAHGPTEAAGAPNRLTFHKMECLSCDGEGTVEVLDLDATRPHCAICDTCDGTGLVEPYCPTCESKLTVDGWCYDCDDWGSLVYVERIAPGRVAV